MGMLSRFKLASWINVHAAVEKTMRVVGYLTTRPDFPTAGEIQLTAEQRANIPELLVCKPDLSRTADDKHNVSEFILPSDLSDGGASPSAVLLLAMLPMLAMLTKVAMMVVVAGLTSMSVFRLPLLALGGATALSLAIISVALGYALGRSMSNPVHTVFSWFGAYALPLLLSIGGSMDPDLYRNFEGFGVPFLGSVGWVGGLIVLGIGLVVLVGPVFAVFAEQDRWGTITSVAKQVMAVLLAIAGSVGVATVAGVLGGEHLGSKCAALVYAVLPFVLACGYPLSFAMSIISHRQRELLYFSNRYQGLQSTVGSQVAKEERLQAIHMAGRDTSPVFQVGTSTGVIFDKGSPRAIPKGMPCRFSQKDAGTHMFIFGETGGGKSTSFAQRYLDYWILNDIGGMFLVDGKGELVQMYAKARRFTMIDATSQVAPFEGLEPDEIVMALSQATQVNLGNSKGGASDYFEKQAQDKLTSITNLMFAMVEAEKHYLASLKVFGSDGQDIPSRKWFITPECLEKIRQAAASWDEGYSKVLEYTQFVRLYHPAVERRKRINEQGQEDVEFFFRGSGEAMVLSDHLLNIEAMGNEKAETLKDIFSTVANMTKPLFGNKRIRHWASRETNGYAFEKVLYGERCGINLSMDEFGYSALVYTALFRQRIMRAVKKRTKGWEERDPAQTPILMLMDEAHSRGVIDRDDKEFSSKSRGWKLSLALLTQSVESMVSSIGKEDTDALLQNFKIKIFFRNQDSKRTMDYAIDTIGKGYVSVWQKPLTSVSLIETALVAARSPLRSTRSEGAGLRRKLRALGGGAITLTPEGTGEGVPKFNEIGRDLLLMSSRVDLVSKFKREEEHWVSEADYRENLAPKGRALIQYLRGGVPFHEFIECPYQEFPSQAIMRTEEESDHEVEVERV